MKELQDFLAKAERFLQSAEHSFALGDYDSCASRFYYAMFFVGEAALMTLGFPPLPVAVSSAFLARHLVKTATFDQELERVLRAAYDLRLTGDYAIGTAVSQGEADQVLCAGHQFVAKVRAYLERRQDQTL